MPEIDTPELESEVKAVQVPSGTGVFPNRTLIPIPVPAGVVLVHDAVPQLAIAPASKIRDVKVADVT
jgi:hypothetical protein